jgi:hypothetical protein
MSKQPYHKALEPFAVWNFAAYLLNQKFADSPTPWTTHYTRAKCLWKMFRSPQNRGKVCAEDVLDTITEAIEALPPKKEKSNEPILEPHFKLVSTVHKMVKSRAITYAQAQEYLKATRYAQGVSLNPGEADAEWKSYMLEILKKLGHADKSNWHHRIIDRAAHVIYDDEPDHAGALGAKNEFTQQIFTKTMTLQVWKPENERPGRHYVYTGRYISFFVHLLDQLNDRANLDQLVRRIRRKTFDFLDHTKVWEEVATTYVRLLRRLKLIPEGHERVVFDGMNHEEFTQRSEKMETWAHDPHTSSAYLDIMRDAIDLKRLNNSLMKGPLIDDLIGDSYACLYEEFVRQLPADQQPHPAPNPFPQGTFINMTTDLAGAGDDNDHNGHGRVLLNSMLRAQGDGAADGPLAVSVSAPVGLGLLQSSPPTLAGPSTSEVHRAPAKPGRVKTVTRREIQRKAEAAILKPPPIKTPILSKRIVVEIPSATKDGRDEAGEEGSSPVGDRRLDDAKEEEEEEEEDGGSRASSRRASSLHHDSADGEADAEDSGSELSELEDLVDEDGKKPPFPERDRGQDASTDPAGAEEDADNEEEAEDEDAGGGGDDAGASDDPKSDPEDEEMLDGEDEVEVRDSQENVDDQDTPDADEEEEEIKG